MDFEKITPIDIIKALRTLQNVCLAYWECSPTCPLYLDGCVLVKGNPPDRWKINDSLNDWHAFKG